MEDVFFVRGHGAPCTLAWIKVPAPDADSLWVYWKVCLRRTVRTPFGHLNRGSRRPHKEQAL